MPTFTDVCNWNCNHRTANPTKPKGFLLTANDIAQLAAAYTEGTIDGIRGYHGIDGSGNVVMYFTAVVKDANGVFNDVNITNLKAAHPCPVICGATNALNS